MQQNLVQRVSFSAHVYYPWVVNFCLEMMMAKRPSSDGASWSASELKTLKKLASSGTAAQAAKALGRTAAAVQQKAMRTGISFRKSQRSPAKKK